MEHGVAVTCATSRLSTCARCPDQRYRPGFESGLGREDRSSAFRHVCYRINILGSHLSPSSINLVLAQAGDVSWCRTGHASQAMGYYRITIYVLTTVRKGHEHPSNAPAGVGQLYLTFITCKEWYRNEQLTIGVDALTVDAAACHLCSWKIQLIFVSFKIFSGNRRTFV